MVLRWTAAAVLEAERHFRKIVGYRALPKLMRRCKLVMPHLKPNAELKIQNEPLND